MRLRWTSEPKEWEVAPGETFDATVTLIDEVNNSVVGIVDVDIYSPEKSPVKLDAISSLFLTDMKISHLRLTGKPGTLFTVSLRYIGRQVLLNKIDNIKMQSCHEGFKPNGSTCVCMNSKDHGVARCDSNGKTVYLKRGYWGGKVDKEFVTYHCPAHYCNFTESIVPGEYQYFSGHVCKGDRDQSSVLCGACKPGYSILFGNEKVLKQVYQSVAIDDYCLRLSSFYIDMFGVAGESKSFKWTFKRLLIFVSNYEDTDSTGVYIRPLY